MARAENNTGPLLDHWNPPAGAGDAVACLATSFTFNSEFFEEECLSRFLQLDTDPYEDGPLYLIERDEKLSQVEPISVIVDEAHCKGKRSLRWDLISFRDLQLLHSKISLLVWSNHIRIVIGSCNLTESGYRKNREIAGVFDFNASEGLDKRVLNAVINSLSAILGKLDSDHPGVQRAFGLINRIPDFVKGWPSQKYPEGLECRVLFTGGGEGKILTQINSHITRKNTFINKAHVVSPFYVAPDSDNPGVKQLCKIITKQPNPQLNWYGRVEEQGEEERRMFYGPESLFEIPREMEIHRINFREIPESSEDPKGNTVYRSLHLKSIWLESDDFVFYCIGSSNFTTNGLGISRRPNFEANIIYIVDKKSANKISVDLWGSFPEFNYLNKTPTFCESPEIEDERKEEDFKELPKFFKTAIFKKVGDQSLIEVRFEKKEPLEYEWGIQDESGRSLYDSEKWKGELQPEKVLLDWDEAYIPSELIVYNAQNEKFHFSVVVENAQVLPAPDGLVDLELEVLIQLLATNKPLHHAMRKWLKRSGNEQEIEIKQIVDPHEKVDVSGFLIRRTRRISYAFSMLKAQLERPYFSSASLHWRLRGPIGVLALSEAILREAKSEDEKSFLLAELALELSSIELSNSNGTIDADLVTKELRSLILEINHQAKQIKNQNLMINEYTGNAFKKAMCDV